MGRPAGYLSRDTSLVCHLVADRIEIQRHCALFHHREFNLFNRITTATARKDGNQHTGLVDRLACDKVFLCLG
ncbi:MAG: hypothetical protein G8D79_16600 [gamma proteobacterium symbiont of Ctena orbiculata]